MINFPVKRAYLETEDGQILYRLAGEGEAILLLHMTPRSSDEFKEIIPILAENRQVIAMDLMGLGDSDKPPREYSISDYVQNVIELLNHLGIEKSYILGSVTGGYIAGELAATYPERIHKLILCNVHGFDAEEQEKIVQRYSIGLQIKEDGSHLMQCWLARVNDVGNGELNHRCVIDDLKCLGFPIYPGVAVGKYCLLAKERFKQIQCPTLLLTGDKALVPLEKAGLAKAENQAWLSEAIPQSQEIMIENGTLWMMNQQYERIANLVNNFLKNI